MAAIDSKYHIKIGDFGFVLAKMPRTGRHYYTREEAPHFVNKFSSGEPNYRDSTFFPHWVQLNWLNGFDQEFFDDGGKFYRSSGVNITKSLQLTLQKAFNSVGQLSAGVRVASQEFFRISAGTNLFNDANCTNYYKMEGNSNDSKGTYNGSDTNVTYGTAYGRFGQGAYINGDTSRITLSTGLDLASGSWSYMFRIYISSLATEQWITQASVSNESVAVTVKTDGSICLYNAKSWGSQGGSWTSKAGMVTTGKWYLVCLTSDSTTVNFYAGVDGGTLDSDTGKTFSVIWGAGTKSTELCNYIGSDPVFGNDLVGYIDEIARFSDILTTSEITTFFNANNELDYDPDSTDIKLLGTSDGKIFSWDGSVTITELFNTRRIEWFETGTNADKVVGDTGGTETAQAQSFKVDATCEVKGIELYLKKATGTPGNITVNIETDNSSKPSGTLADPTNSTATITAFTTTDYAWKTVEFPAAFSLTGGNTYWIVIKTAAASNDNNYNCAAKSSSGYSDGNAAHSTDGGSSWTADSTIDLYFRVLGNATSVNVIKGSSLSGSSVAYIGTGSQSSTVNGDARLYSYDGSTFSLLKIFNTTDESSINCIVEYGLTTTKAYIGLGHRAKVYSTEDWETFTLAKTITAPDNPGYVLAMAEYNKRLYVGGGYPEKLPGNNYLYGGFMASFDDYSWENVGEFSHTIITALDTFDNLLFIGTIKKRIYVFNTSSIDKLFELPWDLQITAIKKWDDQLAFATAPTPGSAVSGAEGVYLFDRNGFHNAFSVSSRSWYSLGISSNNLIGGNDDGYIYQTSSSTYQASGYLQTSYDEAQLPSIEKIRRDITLIFDSQPTGCSIKAEYKTDESDTSWTTLGTANTVGDKIKTFNFASGVYSKKISFKITLATSVNTSTPTLKKIIHKYVLSPDFGYMWKMKLLCQDDLVWLDGTEPIGILGADVTAGATSITFKSTDKAIPTEGFPDPNGETAYATIFDEDGNADIFSYTDKTNTTLTGIPATGTYALGAHSSGEKIKITGGNLHRVILDLKESRELFTFTDIDGLTHTVLFNSFQEDNFVINTQDLWGGVESEVPITLLEA